MISIELHPSHKLIDTISIPNECLIESIKAMNEKEYWEILKELLDADNMPTDSLLTLFSYCHLLLRKRVLNPAQQNALKAHINNVINQK
jgi:hypothetical protein